jgi:hypothetical protein
VLPSQFPEVQAYPHLKKLLERQVDMQFHDLRDLVRLPAYTLGMNWAAAARLFDTISGCSICFYEATPAKLVTTGISAKEFKALLKAHFPWSAVPVPQTDAIDVFYVYARNPLAHALGIDVRPGAPVINIAKRHWPLRRVIELDDSANLPKWSAPPLTGSSGNYQISISGLFWGVHRMLHSLFANPKQVAKADATAATIPL